MPINVEVKPRQNESPERMIKRFNKKVKRSGVLEEIRECFKDSNFALLPSLIEEVQLAVNRMESKLWDLKDWEQLKDDIRERRLELKRIKEEKEKMEDAIENMRGMKSI